MAVGDTYPGSTCAYSTTTWLLQRPVDSDSARLGSFSSEFDLFRTWFSFHERLIFFFPRRFKPYFNFTRFFFCNGDVAWLASITSYECGGFSDGIKKGVFVVGNPATRSLVCIYYSHPGRKLSYFDFPKRHSIWVCLNTSSSATGFAETPFLS